MTAEFQEQTKFWQAQDLGELDLLRATYVTHTFAKHIHEGYAIGIIERGAETFLYRGATHTAPAGSIVVIDPGEIHTGQAATERGWSYRMPDPEPGLMQSAAKMIDERWRGLPSFASPVIWDKVLVPRIRSLHFVLEHSPSALERELLFLETMAQLIARHARERPAPQPAVTSAQSIAWARDYLAANLAENVSLSQLAGIASLSPYHFNRTFRNIVGLPPHTYLTQLRVERAKQLLRQGVPIATVAAETGFTDQSHLTRRFKRIVGVPPGEYRKNVQDE